MAITTRSLTSYPVLLTILATVALLSSAFIIGAAYDFEPGCHCNDEEVKTVAVSAEETAMLPAYHRNHDQVAAEGHRVFNNNPHEKRIGFLGVQIASAKLRTVDAYAKKDVIMKGVLVVEPLEEFNAYKAGFAKGDLITHYNSIRVTSAPQLKRLVSTTKPGTRVNVVVQRADQPLVLYPTVGSINIPTKLTGPCPRNRK